MRSIQRFIVPKLWINEICSSQGPAANVGVKPCKKVARLIELLSFAERSMTPFPNIIIKICVSEISPSLYLWISDSFPVKFIILVQNERQISDYCCFFSSFVNGDTLCDISLTEQKPSGI